MRAIAAVIWFVIAYNRTPAEEPMSEFPRTVSAEGAVCIQQIDSRGCITETCRAKNLSWDSAGPAKIVGAASDSPMPDQCVPQAFAHSTIERQPARMPTVHEICVANQSRYPDMELDGLPLTFYQVCLLAHHSHDLALAWCVEQWNRDHALNCTTTRYGNTSQTICN